MTIYEIVEPGVTRSGRAYYKGERDGVLFKNYVLGTPEEIREGLNAARKLKARLEGPR